MHIITVAEFRKDLPQDMSKNFGHIAKIKGACRNAVGKPKTKS